MLHVLRIMCTYCLIFVITGIDPVTFSDWEAIDEYEIREGETRGKLREKVVELDTMMNIVNTSRQR